MTNQEILDYTKKCAEFLGWKNVGDDRYNTNETNTFFYLSEMKFHKGWNWIMNMVIAIESLGFFVHIVGNGTLISTTDSKIIEKYNWNDTIADSTEIFNYQENMLTKKEALVKTIYSFLNWYFANKDKANS